LRSGLAFQRVSFVWLFKTPAWMRQDEKALRVVHRLRLLWLLWNAGVIAFVIAAMLPVR